MLKHEKILVTGATGFLGSYLCRELAGMGCEVVGISSNAHPYGYDISSRIEEKIVFKRVDITKISKLESLFKEYKFDLVFHLAGISIKKLCYDNFGLTFDVNVVGTNNLLLNSGNCDRVIFMSSSAVYGDSKGSTVDESYPTSGRDPYGITKIIGEKLCFNFINNYGRTIDIARSFNTFGIGQVGDFAIPKLITQGLKEKKIQIWNRDYVMDLTYVDNTIDALIAIGNAAETSEIYNIGSGKGVKISEIARIVGDFIDKDIQIVEAEKPAWRQDAGGTVADITKLRHLGWQEKINLEDGLSKTVGWHKSTYQEGLSPIKHNV